MRSLRHVEAIDIGYDTDRIVFAGVDFARGSGHAAADRVPLFDAARPRIEKLPGVERVAYTENTPLQSFSFMTVFLPSGDTLRGPGDMNNIASFVSPGYFGSMGMRVLEGRDFSPDDRRGSEQVLVVNSTFAKTIWPGESAIGKCFRLHTPTDPCRRIVGVVTNAHFAGVIEKPSMAYYVPIAQGGDDGKAGLPGERSRFARPMAGPRLSQLR